MKRNRIFIIADVAGSGPYYHVGEEAMLEVALERLIKIVGRKNIVLGCPHPWTGGRTYNVKTIALPMHTIKTWILHFLLNPFTTCYRILRITWHLWRSDVIFKAGGGNIRGKHSKFIILSLAKFLQKKIFLVSQTIGPLDEPHRTLLRSQLNQAVWIGVRDRHFSGSQLGLPVHSTVDDGVFLKPEHNLQTAQLAQAAPLMVGLSIAKFRQMNQEEFASFFDSTKQVLVDLGATPVFIPHCARRGWGDLELANSIALQWQDLKPVVLDGVQSAKATMALTGSMSLVLATRYHALIFALAMGVPAIAIYHDTYTEAKVRGAFELFELEPFVISIRAVARELSPMVAKALRAKPEFSRTAKMIRLTQLEINMIPYELIRLYLADTPLSPLKSN